MNRRNFLIGTATLSTALLARQAFSSAVLPNLSFSTLGCPDWTFRQIVEFAVAHGYQGIEVRGILHELNLPVCSEFSKQNLAATRQLMKDNHLQFANLGSSATLHYADTAVRAKNIDEGKRFIDLAHELSCPYVRVFPNNFPKEQEKARTMDLIAEGLHTLGDYAKDSGVTVLIESHGDLVVTEDILSVMAAADNKHAGLIWDVTNMWVKTKEPPAQVYGKLKKYIRHTHIKDAKVTGENIRYVLLGKGDVPILEAVDSLRHGGYNGYYSFEWEKLWHPEIEEPDKAIADYADVMRKHFS
ncbi:MAG: sugar phosphate isomerase/epimerase [Bacteroidetes bacterium]|nr:sugar phosphate isomerase/epimerase [Bacteroidota bacterium]MBS1539528.1 sugar phosphate isomerase/epimerase [Bacteroidota bacterium]